LAGSDLAFDVDLLALLQVLAADLGELAPGHDPMPFRLLGLLPALVDPALGGGETEIGDRLTPGGVAHLRIGSQMSDQNDLVDAAHGDFLSGRLVAVDSPMPAS